MRKQQIVQFAALFLLLLAVVSACIRDQDATPTAVSPTVENSTDVAATETVPATSAPAAAATATAVAAVPLEMIDWPPQAVAAEPLPGAEVPVDTSIALRFDQPMDQDSVEAAWDINPAVGGAFTWPRPDTIVFTPAEGLARAQQYRVNVADTAVAQTGLALEEAITFELQTAGDLLVTEMLPADGTKNVQTDGAVTVVFNRPVVPLVSSGQQADLPQPLTFNPAVEGQGEWVSTSIYRFVPDAGFAGATNYQVAIDPQLTDLGGGSLSGDLMWQFTTESPRVVSFLPSNGAQLVSPSEAITITFNMPMDRLTTETAVAFSPAVALDFSWHEDDRVLAAKLQSLLDLGTLYGIIVSNAAQSANGQASLSPQADSSFTTVPFPAVIGTDPADGGLAETWQRGVNIQFASPLDIDTLQDRILIDPEPGKINYFYNEYIDPENPANASINLYLDFALQRNTDYTVTIPGDAADPYGNTLVEAYTWQFSTPDHTPLVSLNLPRDQSQLSTSFASEVQIIHRNVSELTVNLTDVGLPVATLAYFYRDEPLPSDPLQTWTVPLDTPVGEVGVTTIPLADGGVLPTGVYQIQVDAPELNPDSRYWQQWSNLIVVADTNLVVKEMPDEVRIWATELDSGQPVSGRNLVLYDREGRQLGTAVSDGNGFAKFDYAPETDYLDGVIVVSNAPGASGFGVGASNWSGGINPWQMGLNYGYSIPPPLMAYIYTDRPIYRPGDTIYFKGIVREPDYGRYFLPEPQTLPMSISTNFYMESGGLEETILVEVNADGVFSGEYVLPDDVVLGSYQFHMGYQLVEGQRTFTIAEYRKPEFQILMSPDKDETLRGETVAVTLEAEYFFGGTPAGLAVNWTIYEEPFYPQIDGPYYAFADQAGFNYVDVGPYGFIGGGGAFGNYVTSGQDVTDENGRLTITLPADLLQDVDAGSRRVTVEASVIDISNFPVTSSAEVVFHAADYYVGVRPAEYAPPVGQETAVDVITVDWAGDTVGEQDVEVVFYLREWESTRDEGFGSYYTAWQPVDKEVARQMVTTDAQGKTQATFTPQEAGSYIAMATVTDGNGRSQTSTTSLWVVDSDFFGWRTDPHQRSMDLIVDKTDLRAGETAQILVQSPFEGEVQAWLTIERGNLLEQRVVTIDGGSTVLSIPMNPDYAPNVFVSVTAIKPVTAPDSNNPFADIRLGITELQVAPDQFDLNVALTPQERFFEPGETAVYDVRITDQNGSPVSADFSLALVDLAVLTLKEDNAPPILEAFYSLQPYRSQVGSGLFISGEGLEVEVPIEGGGGGGGGGGDLAESALPSLEEEDETRSNFPDTAYWEASVQTDANGMATVEIPLPDTLTTWRLSSKAVNNDTQVGQDESDVIVTLPLLVRPVTPRFFTVGDKLQIGAIVNNNTANAIEATASLEADGFVEDALQPQTVMVPAEGQTLVRWPVTVDDVPFADLTFRVEGADYKDATKPSLGVGPDNLIPVYRYDAQDIVGTAGELDEAGRQVEAVLLPPHVDTRRGSVDLQLSPSLAAALVDALEVVGDREFSFACAHALTDRLLPNVVTSATIADLDLVLPGLARDLTDLISADIARLQRLQKSDGGWGWCYSQISDPWLSAYSLLALAKADKVGFDVDQEVLNDALRYVERQLNAVDSLANARLANRQAFFLYVLAEGGQLVTSEADELVAAHRGLLDSYAKALLLLAYEASGASGEIPQTLLSDLGNEVIMSASGAHWEDASVDVGNLSSDIRGTAMVLSALTRWVPDSALLPPAVRWLMVARTAEIWPTAHESAWSITALGDWLAVSGELDANYDYQVQVNGTSLTEGAFTAENITTSEAVSVPVNTLLQEESNFFDLQRGEGNGRFYYTLHLNSAIAAETVEPVSRGLTIQRTYYDATCDPEMETCAPIDSINAGEQVRVELTVVVPNDLVFAVIEDPIPAGAEGIDPGLATTGAGGGGTVTRVGEDYRSGYWGWWYFNNVEYRDEKVVFLADYLPAGTYQYTYHLQTIIPGEFQVMPAFGYQEFFPEVNGRSEGKLFTIEE